MVRSQEGNTKFFQGVTLAPFLFTIYLDQVLKSSIDCNVNLGLTLKKDKAEDIAQHTSHIWYMPIAITSDSLQNINQLLRQYLRHSI